MRITATPRKLKTFAVKILDICYWKHLLISEKLQILDEFIDLLRQKYFYGFDRHISRSKTANLFAVCFSFKSFFGGLVYVICNCFSSPYCTNVCKEEIFTHVHMWVQSHYRHYDFVYTTSLKDTERNCCSILSSFNDSCNLWKNRGYYLPPASNIWFSLLDARFARV